MTQNDKATGQAGAGGTVQRANRRKDIKSCRGGISRGGDNQMLLRTSNLSLIRTCAADERCKILWLTLSKIDDVMIGGTVRSRGRRIFDGFASGGWVLQLQRRWQDYALSAGRVDQADQSPEHLSCWRLALLGMARL